MSDTAATPPPTGDMSEAMEEEMQAVADTIAFVITTLREHIPGLMSSILTAKAALPTGFDINLVLLVQTPLSDEPLEIYVRQADKGGPDGSNTPDQYKN